MIKGDMNFIMNGMKMAFTYTNWRGETSRRLVLVYELVWGCNEWHPEPQFLLLALDIDKGEERYFALKDMKDVNVLGFK